MRLVPHAPGRGAGRPTGGPPTKGDHDHWTETLKAFTIRNAGRLTILEVDELEKCARREATLMDLKGASSDPHGSCVGLMLALRPANT